MDARRAAVWVGSVVAIAVAAIVLTGHPLVAYASSGSMEPTIGTLDAFLVQPWPRDLRVGDIVVYDSLLKGEPAVHRIVEGDARGWTTKGDANRDTDQLAGEPLVTEDRILGRVVTLGGDPVVLPRAGASLVSAQIGLTKLSSLVGGAANLRALALVAVVGVLAVAPKRGAVRRRLSPRVARGLRRLFPRGILGRHVGFALVLLVVASSGFAAMHARTTLPLQMVVVAEPTAADGARAAAPGGELLRDATIGSLGWLPTFIVAEPGSDAVRILDAGLAFAAPWRTVRVTVGEVAGSSVGLQEDALHLWRYPALLPQTTTLALHRALPGSPYAALAGALVAGGWLWWRLLGISALPVSRWLGLREEWL